MIGCNCDGCVSEDPLDKRLRSSVLVEQDGLVVVIDTGPDFRQQMLRARVDRLDAVLFTHEHRDHMAGLDDIRAFNFIQRRPMDIYAEERVLRALNSSFPYIFAEKRYPGIPQVVMNAIGMEPFRIGSLQVIPIRMMHYRLPVLGFRIGNFAYLTDGNFISQAEMEKLSGLKYLVVNALRREIHLSHFNLEQAITLIGELGPERAYLTHISHQLGPNTEWKKELPGHVEPAFDGLVLEL